MAACLRAAGAEAFLVECLLGAAVAALGPNMNFPWSRRRKDLERELQEELDAHFAIDMQQRVKGGCDPDEATFAA